MHSCSGLWSNFGIFIEQDNLRLFLISYLTFWHLIEIFQRLCKDSVIHRLFLFWTPVKSFRFKVFQEILFLLFLERFCKALFPNMMVLRWFKLKCLISSIQYVLLTLVTFFINYNTFHLISFSFFMKLGFSPSFLEKKFCCVFEFMTL